MEVYTENFPRIKQPDIDPAAHRHLARMQRRVAQRYQTDCGVAAMAMLLNVPYEEAAALFPYPCANDSSPWNKHEYYQTSCHDDLWILLERGIPAVMVSPLERYAPRPEGQHQMRYTKAKTNDEIWQFLQGKEAVLQVDSLVNEGGAHAVFWDGEAITDPQYNLQAGSFYEEHERPSIQVAVIKL